MLNFCSTATRSQRRPRRSTLPRPVYESSFRTSKNAHATSDTPSADCRQWFAMARSVRSSEITAGKIVSSELIFRREGAFVSRGVPGGEGGGIVVGGCPRGTPTMRMQLLLIMGIATDTAVKWSNTVPVVVIRLWSYSLYSLTTGHWSVTTGSIYQMTARLAPVDAHNMLSA